METRKPFTFMATSINLTLTMDASGVVTVANQAGQALQKIQPPSPKVKQEFDGIESAEKRAHIAGTLFANVTGVEMPKALEQVIAKSQLVGPALSAAFNASVILAAGSALIPLAERIHLLMDDWGGYTEAVKKVGQATIEASKQAFITPKTISDTQAHLDQINSEISLYEKAAQASISRSDSIALAGTLEQKIVAAVLNGTVNEAASNALHAKGNALLGDQEALIKQRGLLQEQYNKQLDAANAKAATAGLQGFALLNAQYVAQQKDILAGTVGDEKARDSLLTSAHTAYLGERLALERQVTDEVIALRHQVDEAAVQGIAKINVQEQDALADVTRRQQQSLITEQAAQQERALIHKRTSDQIIQFQRQESIETNALFDEARDAQLSGDDLIYAHQQEQVTKQRDLYQQNLIDFDTYQQRIQAIDELTQAQITANHRQTARELGNLQEQQKDAESAVALSYVDDWQKSLAQTLVDRDKQLRLIDQQERELLVQYANNQGMIDQITQTEQARRQAVWAQTDEKIREEHKQMVEQLGSDITSVFDDIASGNIGKRILQNVEKLFAEIIAQWLLSLNIMKSTAGGLFGNIIFGPGSTGASVFGGSNFLGNLFGTSSSNLVPSGSSGFSPSITGFSSTAGFSLPGLTAGGGLAGAIAGTGTTPTFSASNALTTQSMAQISNSTGVFKTGGGAIPLFGSSGNSSGLGGLFGARGLAAAAPLAMMLLGGAGGKIGMAGGLLGGLTMSGMLGPAISQLYGVLGLGGTGALIGGGVGGLLGFGIGSQHGGLLGSLAGAGSGALTGFMVGGPIGAVVGGVIGLLGGIFGGVFGSGKRKRQAQDYAASTVIPDIKQITSQFDTFQLDSSSAMQQLEQLRTSAQQQLAALKSQGKDVFNQTVGPAIDDAEKHVQGTETERERRAAIIFGAPQFHDGGVVDVMRASIRRQPDEMLAWLKHGERVMNPGASARHGRTLDAMNAGRGVGPNITLNIRALDVKDFDTYLRSGGMQAIISNINRALEEGQL